MKLVAIMAENSTAERPGPYTQGTLLIVRSLRKLYYWDGMWEPMTMLPG